MAAIVLAGGASKRMGSDKSRIEWHGLPLVQYVAKRVLSIEDTVLIIGSTTEDWNSVHGCRSVNDHWPGEGPLGGLISGLLEAGPGLHLVTACDSPFVSASAYRLLRVAAVKTACAVATLNNRVYPLYGYYDHSVLNSLKLQFDAGERSLTRAIRFINPQYVDETEIQRVDPQLVTFTNLNTPENVEFARTIQWPV